MNNKEFTVAVTSNLYNYKVTINAAGEYSATMAVLGTEKHALTTQIVSVDGVDVSSPVVKAKFY